MKVRTNEVYKAVTAELDAIGATYHLEERAKHPVLVYEKDGQRGQITIPTSAGDWRAHLNAKRDVRKSLRERGLLKGEVTAFDALPNDISKGQQEAPIPAPAPAEASPTILGQDSLVELDGEPRMRDVDVGSALGYARSNNVRALIEANIVELRLYGTLEGQVQASTESGGRPAKGYLLNREQSLLIAMLSRTPRAIEVRHQVIKAYSDWERAHADPQPAPSQEIMTSEILANDQAIEAIVERVRAAMPVQVAPAQPTIQSDHLVTRKQFEEVMANMASYLRRSFDRNDRLLGDVYNARIDTGEGISNRVIQSHRTFLEEIKAAMAESSATVTAAVESLKAMREASVQTEVPAQAPVIQPPAEVDMSPREDYVIVGEIYEMIGIDPMRINERRSLGKNIGHSLTQFCEERDIPMQRVRFRQQYRNRWPRSAVAEWYRLDGRDLIVDHLERHR